MNAEPHEYLHEPAADTLHEPGADCPCYYCHRTPREHIDRPANDAAPDVLTDLDRNDLADDLAAEYAKAVQRDRDRALEARYGGRILRLLTTDPMYAQHSPESILAYARSLAVE